ncbi:MAG: alpha/beta hydrolase [Armatimonadota bacterium]|nr:alpha/beta hydrolase [Armatimonadota bacterium]
MAIERLKELLEKINSQPRDPNPTTESRRARMERIRERVANDVRCEPIDVGGVRAEWIVPPGADSDRVIVYLHGGGYVIGSINTHRALIARIARASKARALAIDYRLAPEHPFPAALDDATAAYRWLISNRHPACKIVIAGDSAGGGLTLAVLAELRAASDPMPAAAALISPWTDMEGTGNSMRSKKGQDPTINGEDLVSMAALYVGANDPKNPLASPLYADFRGFPPLLIQVGDTEVLLDDSIRVAERAKSAGVKVELEVWEGMVHVWHIYAKLLPEGQQAIDKLGKFAIAQTS